MNGATLAAFGTFPRTESIWGFVQRVQAGEETQKALEELLKRYWPPLKAHLVCRKGVKSDRAEDILQGFIADKILRLGLIERADLKKGRFRSFVLTALDRYLIDETRKRREPVGSLEDVACVVPPAAAPVEQEDETAFNVAWAAEVIATAAARMRESCEISGRPEVWAIFEQRCLDPILKQAQPVPYSQLVAQFGLESPGQASNLLITAKRMFERAMESVISEYEPGDAEVREEFEALKKSLSRAAGGPRGR